MNTKGLDFLETKKCPICRKYFSVLYPHLWRYKVQITSNRYKYFCSWKCLRADEQRRSNEEMEKMKKDGTPAKKPGRKPAIKQDAEPKTAGEAMAACDNAVNQFFTACEDMGLMKQNEKIVFAPDGEHIMKIQQPLRYEGFTVTAIKRDYGRYERSELSGTEYLDFEANDGEEISMPVESWKAFLKELKEAAKVLGVDLNETDPS